MAITRTPGSHTSDITLKPSANGDIIVLDLTGPVRNGLHAGELLQKVSLGSPAELLFARGRIRVHDDAIVEAALRVPGRFNLAPAQYAQPGTVFFTDDTAVAVFLRLYASRPLTVQVRVFGAWPAAWPEVRCGSLGHALIDAAVALDHQALGAHVVPSGER